MVKLAIIGASLPYHRLENHIVDHLLANIRTYEILVRVVPDIDHDFLPEKGLSLIIVQAGIVDEACKSSIDKHFIVGAECVQYLVNYKCNNCQGEPVSTNVLDSGRTSFTGSIEDLVDYFIVETLQVSSLVTEGVEGFGVELFHFPDSNHQGADELAA